MEGNVIGRKTLKPLFESLPSGQGSTYLDRFPHEYGRKTAGKRT
jgi:hypothetical protein